jgi:hypothetical protein
MPEERQRCGCSEKRQNESEHLHVITSTVCAAQASTTLLEGNERLIRHNCRTQADDDEQGS